MAEEASLICAIDQGTSSSRVLIFDSKTWTVISSHQVSTKSVYPAEGWCEQDPFEILESVKASLDGAVRDLEEKNYSRKQIAAVGITNQRETTIVWDKNTGQPLYNAIIWLDNRTEDEVKQLIHSHGSDVHRDKTGLPLSTYFSAFKYKWIINNVERARIAADEDRLLFGNVDSWLIWNLSGGPNGVNNHVTDVTNASRTMLMNLETLKWDKDLSDFFGIKESSLPTIKSSAEIYCKMDFENCPISGIPISGCLGDQQAALVGHKCFRAGMAKSTYGTGCFILYNVGSKVVKSTHGLLSTVAYQMGPDAPPSYALEGSISAAGAAVNWLRGLGLIQSAGEIAEHAAKVHDTGDVIFVPAFNGLFAPYWRPDARGMIIGITQYTSKGHICRATMEAVVFQVCEIMKAMQLDSQIDLQKLMVDGGMTKNDLLMQIQADLLGIPVERPEMVESTSLGAAFAAAVGINLTSFDEQEESHPNVTLFNSGLNDDLKSRKFQQWKDAIGRCLNWA